jgi:CBS-domain-containing membrane protein
MLTAADIMTKDVITVTRETTVRELAELFLTHRVSSIPVVEGANRLVGMVTESDLIEKDRNLHIPTVFTLFDGVFYLESERVLQEQLKKITGQKVADIFTAKVRDVSPGTPLSSVADIMASERINALPVTDNGCLVGIVARIDLIRTMIAQGEV